MDVRGATADQPMMAVQSSQMKSESLRDYWKRRAEESKAASASVGGEGSSSSNGDEETLGTLSTGGGTTNHSMGKTPPPPPPPSNRAKSRGRSESVATTVAPRSKSRGRDERGNDPRANAVAQTSSDRSRPPTASATKTSVSLSSSSLRKGDSIASAHSVGRRATMATSATMGPEKTRTSSSSDFATKSMLDVKERRTSSLTPGSLSDSVLSSMDNLKDASPLHRCLAKSSWRELSALLPSFIDNDDVNGSAAGMIAILSEVYPRNENTTALHVLAWKAPPALATTMLRVASDGGNGGGTELLRELLISRDGDGNTPLHLCAGNLDHRMKDMEVVVMGQGGVVGRDLVCLAVLEEMTMSAPAGAWTLQNTEGDTPLHLLVSSLLCTCSDDGVRTGLAAAAMSIVLSSPGAAEACAVKDNSGATPLHVALAAGAHDCVVEALMTACPEAARIKDIKGMLPLHWTAAFGKTGHTAIRRLVEGYPEGLTAVTIDGDIPLHLAVSNAVMGNESGDSRETAGKVPEFIGIGDSVSSRREMNRLKIVELLIHDHTHYTASGRRNAATRDSPLTTLTEGNASPILTTNREKLTPLHCCALFDAPSQISKLLMKHPDANAASSMTNSFGATPLHLAAAQPGVSQSIATVLAIGSPDAAAVQDRLKRTPLHVAAQNAYATNLLIKTLAELNPKAASVKTQRGHLPLHLAAQSQAKEAVVRALIKAHPAAAESRNKSNNTPLHDAAKYRASLGVVRLLLDAYPGALYVQNQYGNLPLHCATAYQAPSDVVQLLLKSWPEGASVQNRNQDAPLHYAAAYATSVAAVRPLIEAAPAAVLLLNSSGQSPVDRAKANNAPGDIIRLLENAADDYSRNSNGDGSWASFDQGGRRVQI